MQIGTKSYPVLRVVDVRGRTFLLLERLSDLPRQRYLAFDPRAGVKGELRTIYLLPRSASTTQHIKALKRASSSSDPFPLILDFDARSDPIIVVMLWIPGINLRTFLEEVQAGTRPRPSPTESFKRVHGFAHGLARRHRKQQLVHRDIKPANLILERDSGRLVLIDFGSAWGTEATANRGDGDGFHASYAAPELQGGPGVINFRSDLFSLGVILYELITLELPYDNLGGKAGRPEYVQQMKNCLTPPSRLSPDFNQIPQSISAGMDRLICRALALEPDERFATPGAWLDELDHVRALIQRPGPSAPPRSWFGGVIGRLADFFSKGRNSSGS